MASGSTDRLNLPQWLLGTEAFLRSEMNAAFVAIDELVAMADQGTGAPAVSAASASRSFYFDTVARVLYYSDGVSSWIPMVSLGSSTPTAISVAGSAAAGSSSAAARADHAHAGPGFGSTPATIGLTSSSGSATSVSRSDHVHGIVDNTITPAKLSSTVAGSGLIYDATSGIAVNPGTTTAVSGNALVVKSASLTQTQPSATYRFARTGEPSSDVAQGDVTVNASNELKVRNASAWQKPENLPWGVLGVVNTTTALSGSSGADLTGVTATVTVGANRLIRLRCTTPGVAVAAGAATLTIKEGSTVLQRSTSYGPNALSSVPLSVETIFTPAAGSHTYKIAIECGVSWTIQTNAGAFQSLVFVVEDIGPAL